MRWAEVSSLTFIDIWKHRDIDGFANHHILNIKTSLISLESSFHFYQLCKKGSFFRVTKLSRMTLKFCVSIRVSWYSPLTVSLSEMSLSRWEQLLKYQNKLHPSQHFFHIRGILRQLCLTVFWLLHAGQLEHLAPCVSSRSGAASFSAGWVHVI